MQESLCLSLKAPASFVSITRWEKLGWACKDISSENHSSGHSNNGQAFQAFVDGWVKAHVLLDMNEPQTFGGGCIVMFSVICPHLVTSV